MHNTPLRYCTCTIYNVALTRKFIERTDAKLGTLLHCNRTRPVLYVLETESCVKLCNCNTVLLFCDNSWACCIKKNRMYKIPNKQGFQALDLLQFEQLHVLFLFRIGYVVKLSSNLYKLSSRSTPRDLAELTIHYWWMICADNFIIFDPRVQLRGWMRVIWK